MQLQIRNQKDFAAGLIYVAAGAAFSIGALEYRMGDAARMGPAYFPFWVGILLAAVGMATVATAFGAKATVEKVKN